MTLNYPDAHTADRKPVSLRPMPWDAAPQQSAPPGPRPATMLPEQIVQTPFRPAPKIALPRAVIPEVTCETTLALAWSAMCRREGHVQGVPGDQKNRRGTITERAIAVLRACHRIGGGAGSEIAAAMGVHYDIIGSYMIPLVDAGLLDREKARRAPDKPGSMVWRYTITAAGRAKIGAAS